MGSVNYVSVWEDYNALILGNMLSKSCHNRKAVCIYELTKKSNIC